MKLTVTLAIVLVVHMILTAWIINAVITRHYEARNYAREKSGSVDVYDGETVFHLYAPCKFYVQWNPNAPAKARRMPAGKRR